MGKSSILSVFCIDTFEKLCYSSLHMLPSSTTREAYAKINLHLAVCAKREDGYHDLSTLFQLISLHDTIDVAIRPSTGFSCAVEGLDGCCLRGEDSMSRAARLWCGLAGVSAAVSIRCRKRIPVQAGLGGGSSDAAAVLCALQSLFPDRALDVDSLMDVGLAVGSDVPFFLFERTAAWARGRGEFLEPVETPSGYHVLVLMPRTFGVSTAQAFAALDSAPGRHSESWTASEVGKLFAEDCSSWPFYNDFACVVGHDELYAVLQAACDSKRDVFGSLTGSGSAWYAVSRDEAALDSIRSAAVAEFGDDISAFRAKMLCDHRCDDTL